MRESQQGGGDILTPTGGGAGAGATTGIRRHSGNMPMLITMSCCTIRTATTFTIGLR